jgi:Nucleotide modification associated domain 3
MTCKPALHRSKELEGLEKRFQVTNLKRLGRLQFFFHCPQSALPIRDVVTRKKREPHIEKSAENYCVKCYQPNIVGFLKSSEKYLFLFTKCASREPALRKYRGRRFVVGYITKERWLPRRGHYAVQGFTKIVAFGDAFDLSKFGIEARHWRVKRFDQRETLLILEHLNRAKNIRRQCIQEIKRLTPTYPTTGLSQVVLLRVGIDSGRGGIQGPLLKDGSFEFIPIDDRRGDSQQTYGNTRGVHGRRLIEYFPERLRDRLLDQPIHFDPEFKTFTYGDPTVSKRGLLRLQPGSLLVFYAGLEKWPEKTDAGLYIIAYFEVTKVGLATGFSQTELEKEFGENFHVHHKNVLERQKSKLVLVKGGKGSRLLKKAQLISSIGQDRNGQPLKVLAPAMRKIFGDFDGHVSIQRSPPRWVKPAFVERAVEFVRSLK